MLANTSIPNFTTNAAGVRGDVDDVIVCAALITHLVLVVSVSDMDWDLGLRFD